MNDKVAILHTNDLHSHFENWPKISRFMRIRGDELKKQGYQVYKVDDGDAIDRSNKLTDATSGKANIELMNEVDYDAATIGNNEALTTTHEELDELYKDAKFPVVLDNVVDERTGGIPKWAVPYHDVNLAGGRTMRFMGLTAPYDTYDYMDWQSLPIMSSIETCLNDWKGQYDVLVLLSHLGINNDRAIAERFPAINVIIGGHTHHLLKTGEVVNQTLLAAAEKWGHYVGEVTFELNDKNQFVNPEARTYKVSDMKFLPGDKEQVEVLEEKGKKLLAKQKVAKLPKTFKTSLNDDNDLVDLGIKAIEEKAGTTCGVLNTGLFLTDLKKGIVDEDQIQSMLPHAMHVMKTTFWGYDLWRMVKEMEKNKGFLVHFEQKGMGFRGKYFGRLIFDGIRYDEKNERLYFHDQLVQPQLTYEIALLDHYSFIPFFPTISIAGTNHIYFDETLKDVFSDYLGEKFPL